MKKILFILLLASCHSNPSVIPKAGEVWKVDEPFKATVKIDSIDQFNCVRFSWEDSAGKHIGVCDMKLFHGEVKPIRDTNAIEKILQQYIPPGSTIWFPPGIYRKGVFKAIKDTGSLYKVVRVDSTIVGKIKSDTSGHGALTMPREGMPDSTLR